MFGGQRGALGPLRSGVTAPSRPALPGALGVGRHSDARIPAFPGTLANHPVLAQGCVVLAPVRPAWQASP